MQILLKKIRACKECEAHLPLGPNPIVSAHSKARIVIIGQAPGTSVHKTGIPWNDPSGKQLRKWMGITNDVFYDETKIALIPMGFCYPGKGKTGDLPPRPECAPLWHEKLLRQMPHVSLTLLIGQYSQRYYLQNSIKKNLTETVRSFKDFEKKNILPLPHPSPRNRFWLTKNSWFLNEIIPVLQTKVKQALC